MTHRMIEQFVNLNHVGHLAVVFPLPQKVFVFVFFCLFWELGKRKEGRRQKGRRQKVGPEDNLARLVRG